MRFLIVQHTNINGGSLNAAIELLSVLKKTFPSSEVDFYVDDREGNISDKIISYGASAVYNNFGICTFDYFNGCNSFLKVLAKYIVRKKTLKKWRQFFKTNYYDLVFLNSIVEWPIIKTINKESKVAIFVRETLKGKSSSLVNNYIRKNVKAHMAVFLTEYDQKAWGLNCPFLEVIPESTRPPVFSEDKKTFLKDKQFLFNKCNVLFFGGVVPIKGLDLCLKSFSVLKTEANLIVLGEKESTFGFLKMLKYLKQFLYQSRIKRIIKRHSLEKKVLFIGYTNDVYNWLSASSFVVFSASEVHQPKPGYEAGAVKKTIILPNYPNYYENFTDGYNCLFYERNNFQDLSSKIEQLLNDSKTVEVLGNNNYSVYLKSHCIDVIERKISSAVLKIIDENKAE